ncbi:MAG TPA: aminotransferase class I/II-fold pyridoxal phosphate-dependent enzyme [Longimicrobiales bacterium]
MNAELERVLRTIEDDMSAQVADHFTKIAADYFSDSANAGRPVGPRTQPADLLQRLPRIPAEARPLEEVLANVRDDVVAESNWLYHPRYMGHQVTAPLPAAVWAEPVVGALNQSVAVREMSPAVTVLEKQLIDWMAGAVGFPAEAGGTLTSGGTEATFTALLAARAHVLPDAWENGMEGRLPVVLCGEHAHYAVTRATAQLGLGLKRALQVGSADFRMDVRDLKTRLAQLGREGTPVMAVIATAGSTPTGSFDDLHAIADVCDEHNVWLHVDGAHGASALLSDARRSMLAGIERARSVAWDPHKMMLMPLSVGVVLVRAEAELDAAFRQRAPYLFHAQAGGRSWDQGGRSFQCSRRADALKLWVALQRYGTRAFGLLYDHFCDLTMELHRLLAQRTDFEVLHEPQCNILCFRYLADGQRSEAELNQLNHALRVAYNTEGTGWLTTTVLNDQRVLRTTLMNPRIRVEQLRALVSELAERGWALLPQTRND